MALWGWSWQRGRLVPQYPCVPWKLSLAWQSQGMGILGALGSL